MDTYNTIIESSQGIYKEKGSKFIALLFHIENEEEAKRRIEIVRKEYHDARHHCYAYMLGNSGDQYRTNDDGEPSGTAGRPILGQIRSKKLTNILIVVVRYFGGTLLGTSGLINAYKTAAEMAILSGKIEEKIIFSHFRISFRYELTNNVMKILKEEQIEQSNHHFDNMCSIDISIRQSLVEKVISKLAEHSTVYEIL